MTQSRNTLNGEETTIHNLLCKMSAQTGKAIEDAISCFRAHDGQLAQNIIDNDAEINKLQQEVEHECLVTIAKHQPVASDLRDLVSDIHIAIELERIADHAADIAKIVKEMHGTIILPFVDDVESLGTQCREMLNSIMQAYHERDEQLAKKVALMDEVVDRTEKNIIEDILAKINEDTSRYMLYTHILWVTHNLERIGDRITNIAERVVFMTTGENLDLNR